MSGTSIIAKISMSLTLKAPLNFAADDNSNCVAFSKETNKGMIFHENRLLADDSHVISYLIFVEIGKDVLKFVVCCSRDWRFKC